MAHDQGMTITFITGANKSLGYETVDVLINNAGVIRGHS
jgi:NADP-dependent 3-hydroxy acid dehydrogenase YdfG